MKKPIYMDHHATTPVDPRVLEEMLPCFTEGFGNPASRTHAFGWAAEEAVERARERVARAIGARARDLVFTAGATEANNLAIRGVLGFHGGAKRHVVTGATEHSSILGTLRVLEKAGAAEVTILPVDRTGRIDPEAVDRAITETTALATFMAANNEIGTLHPLEEIGRVTRSRGVFFHTDATQAVGKEPLDVDRMGIDLLSLSSHKVYGPKGVGALYVRGREPRVRLEAQITGGGHERGLRSGTLNVPGIVGLGRACEIAVADREEESQRILELRDRLVAGLADEIEDLFVNGHPEERLPGNASVTFRYVEGEALLMALQDDVALSSGSACTSATLEPSHVLRAIGLRDEDAQATVRFGLGRFTTDEEVDRVVSRVVAEVARLRALSPFWAGRKRAAPREARA